MTLVFLSLCFSLSSFFLLTSHCPFWFSFYLILVINYCCPIQLFLCYRYFMRDFLIFLPSLDILCRSFTYPHCVTHLFSFIALLSIHQKWMYLVSSFSNSLDLFIQTNISACKNTNICLSMCIRSLMSWVCVLCRWLLWNTLSTVWLWYCVN